MLKRSALVLGSLALSLSILSIGGGALVACANSGGDDGGGGGPDSSVGSQDSTISQDATGGDSTAPDDTSPPPDTGSTMMGTIPTTCAEANNSFGCCLNGVEYYCGGDAGTVSSKTCSSVVTDAGVTLTCGWNSAKGYYGCVSPPAMADPSGAEPLACGGSSVDSGTKDTGAPVDSGAPVDTGAPTDSGAPMDTGPTSEGGTGSIPTTCAQAYNVTGCCGPNGDNYYCPSDGGALTKTVCAAGKVCGWNASKKYYGCVTGPATTDPSGTNPIACQ
jgi:hypothetical protein